MWDLNNCGGFLTSLHSLFLLVLLIHIYIFLFRLLIVFIVVVVVIYLLLLEFFLSFVIFMVYSVVHTYLYKKVKS